MMQGSPTQRVRVRSQAGFTLVELMTVVAIVGVISGIALMAIDQTSYAGTVRGFANETAAEMDTARMRAVSTRKWQRIEFAADNVTHWEADTEGMGDPPNWVLIRTIYAPKNVEVHAVSDRTHVTPGDGVPAAGDGLGTAIEFAPDGAARSAGTAFFGDTSDKRRARVAVYRATGSVYIFEEW